MSTAKREYQSLMIEHKRRQERNGKLLARLENIEKKAAFLQAKTDRIKSLKSIYRSQVEKKPVKNINVYSNINNRVIADRIPVPIGPNNCDFNYYDPLQYSNYRYERIYNEPNPIYTLKPITLEDAIEEISKRFVLVPKEPENTQERQRHNKYNNFDKSSKHDGEIDPGDERIKTRHGYKTIRPETVTFDDLTTDITNYVNERRRDLKLQGHLSDDSEEKGSESENGINNAETDNKDTGNNAKRVVETDKDKREAIESKVEVGNEVENQIKLNINEVKEKTVIESVEDVKSDKIKVVPKSSQDTKTLEQITHENVTQQSNQAIESGKQFEKPVDDSFVANNTYEQTAEYANPSMVHDQNYDYSTEQLQNQDQSYEQQNYAEIQQEYAEPYQEYSEGQTIAEQPPQDYVEKQIYDEQLEQNYAVDQTYSEQNQQGFNEGPINTNQVQQDYQSHVEDVQQDYATGQTYPDGYTENQEYSEQTTQEYVQQSGPEYAEPTGQEYVEQTGQEYGEQMVQEYAEQSGQEYAEQTGHEYAEQSGQEYAEQTGQEYAEQTGQEYAEQAAQEYAEQTGQEYAEQTGQEYAEQAGHEYSHETEQYAGYTGQEYVEQTEQNYVDPNLAEQSYDQTNAANTENQEYYDQNQYPPTQETTKQYYQENAQEYYSQDGQVYDGSASFNQNPQGTEGEYAENYYQQEGEMASNDVVNTEGVQPLKILESDTDHDASNIDESNKQESDFDFSLAQ